MVPVDAPATRKAISSRLSSPPSRFLRIRSTARMRPGVQPAVNRGDASFGRALAWWFKHKMRNFRRASVANRQNYGAEPPAYINLGAAQRVAALLEAHFFIGAAVNTAYQGQANLASVRVAGEHEADAHARRVFDNRRIVREQHRWRAIGNTAQSARQIRAIQKIVNPREAELLPAAAQSDVPVAQDFNSIVEIGRASCRER